MAEKRRYFRKIQIVDSVKTFFLQRGEQLPKIIIFLQKRKMVLGYLIIYERQVQRDNSVDEGDVGREFSLLGIDQNRYLGMGIVFPYTLEKRGRLEKVSHLGKLDNENTIHRRARRGIIFAKPFCRQGPPRLP